MTKQIAAYPPNEEIETIVKSGGRMSTQIDKGKLQMLGIELAQRILPYLKAGFVHAILVYKGLDETSPPLIICQVKELHARFVWRKVNESKVNGTNFTPKGVSIGVLAEELKDPNIDEEFIGLLHALFKNCGFQVDFFLLPIPFMTAIISDELATTIQQWNPQWVCILKEYQPVLTLINSRSK